MARILVLEDEPSQRFVMADLLERCGHVAMCTASPRAAVEAACDFKPEVLVADWRLKAELTGRDVAEALRGRDPQLQVIFITSLPRELVRGQAVSLEPFRIVGKPCEFYDLLLAIHESLKAVPQIVGEGR